MDGTAVRILRRIVILCSAIMLVLGTSVPAQASIVNQSSQWTLTCEGTVWTFMVHYHHETSNSGEQAYAEWITRLSGPRQLTHVWFYDAGPNTPINWTKRVEWSYSPGMDHDTGHAFTGGWYSTGRAWWSINLDNGTSCNAGFAQELLYGTA